jgi:hypothetical protein
MSQATITDREEGKRVVNADGETIGVVSGVRGETAYVDPDPSMGERIKSMLGWEHIDDGDYPLDTDLIDTVDEDEVRLKRQP